MSTSTMAVNNLTDMECRYDEYSIEKLQQHLWCVGFLLVKQNFLRESVC